MWVAKHAKWQDAPLRTGDSMTQSPQVQLGQLPTASFSAHSHNRLQAALPSQPPPALCGPCTFRSEDASASGVSTPSPSPADGINAAGRSFAGRSSIRQDYEFACFRTLDDLDIDGRAGCLQPVLKRRARIAAAVGVTLISSDTKQTWSPSAADRRRGSGCQQRAQPPASVGLVSTGTCRFLRLIFFQMS